MLHRWFVVLVATVAFAAFATRSEAGSHVQAQAVTVAPHPVAVAPQAVTLSSQAVTLVPQAVHVQSVLPATVVTPLSIVTPSTVVAQSAVNTCVASSSVVSLAAPMVVQQSVRPSLFPLRSVRRTVTRSRF